MPTFRITSATGTPSSACFSTVTICSTEKRFFFMAKSPLRFCRRLTSQLVQNCRGRSRPSPSARSQEHDRWIAGAYQPPAFSMRSGRSASALIGECRRNQRAKVLLNHHANLGKPIEFIRSSQRPNLYDNPSTDPCNCLERLTARMSGKKCHLHRRSSHPVV